MYVITVIITLLQLVHLARPIYGDMLLAFKNQKNVYLPKE